MTAPDPGLESLEYVTHRLLGAVRKAIYGTEPEAERMKLAWKALHEFERESGIRRLEDFFRKGWAWESPLRPEVWHQKALFALWRLAMPRPRW